MSFKLLPTLLLCAVPLSAVGGPQREARTFERMLPSPEQILEHLDELGLPDDRIVEIREEARERRAEFSGLRATQAELQADLSAAMAGEPFDPVRIETAFERLLDVENQQKRLQLSGRLALMGELDAAQRERVRGAAVRMAELRVTLRDTIEEIRILGRELHDRGEPTQAIRERMRRIERQIRAGRLREADRASRDVVRHLQDALGH
ncbi:hypothetical protein Poly30_11520 [Planctomycetes bacterium Poly30]|uniref:LTXXQ motif protein n=2 Tax=Saltatorellus ferox TaxID=2528018 RepID=A0A518ENJ9_9BACT|nr:hypothetical protein Poly30_11520 [Planctomycetes bacterium Poly30]